MKTNKTQKPKSSNSSNVVLTAQQKLEQELAKLGMTLEEAQDWLRDGRYNSRCANCSCETSQSCAYSEPPESESNVLFHPGTTTENTAVYVAGVRMHGVTRAVLEYDAELGVPVLRLDLLGVKLPY